jgi:cyclic beta-1,2-glucan synthetase
MPNETRLVPVASRDAHLLSNGRYTVVLTPAGSGFSRWRDLQVTRWREDATCQGWGSYLLLADRREGSPFSPCLLPYAGDVLPLVASFSDGRAEFVRRDKGLTSRLEIAVASDRDAEVRRVTLTNEGALARDIVLTSYMELVLGDANADAAHPAFSKLFVQTEALNAEGVLVATRRRKGPQEPSIWAAHFCTGPCVADTSFETDRARFLGRGNDLRHAQAMLGKESLSDTAGTTLDPIFSLRRCVHVAPGESVSITFVTAAAESRERLIGVCDSLRSTEAIDVVFANAREHAERERARFGLEGVSGLAWMRLLAPLLSSDSAWRASPGELARGAGGAPSLWSLGISGDRPIVLLRIADASKIYRVQNLARLQRYFQAQNIGIDVVVVNGASRATVDDLQARLHVLVSGQQEELRREIAHIRAEVFLLRQDALSSRARDGLATAARVTFEASDPGMLNPQDRAPESRPQRIVPPAKGRTSDHVETPPLHASLEFDNGIGGFDAAAREYAMTLREQSCTPMPWINVVANPAFGFIVSAEGGGYTWSIDSQQNPLTPWPNDPVTDAPHEILYLFDEDSGELWSATAHPCRVSTATYSVRHGKGYSRFAHSAHDIEHELVQCVPVDGSIKLSRLRIRNRAAHSRRLRVTAYVEWALGPNGTVTPPFVVSALDDATGALFASNRWRAEFADRVAFADLAGAQQSFTADRTEFLGRHGAIDRPATLFRESPLSGRTGAELDPCAALQTRIELDPGATIDVVFLLGDADSPAEARKLIERYRSVDVDDVLSHVRALWNGVLDTVQVRTPDRALDLMLNDWLLYQTMGCRLWARTAYYQASGAYGFRDQLQDVMALCLARSDLAREHLLRAASRQFVQGDVQHWWLSPAGRGLRTRMVDDRVWLVYAALHYLDTTADKTLLDEIVAFIDGDTLKDGQSDAFFAPRESDEQASFYEHCARAIDASLSVGAHGLPLMGTGDWNDGMNRVGENGRGESIWMGWFLLDVIARFSPYAEARAEHARARNWKEVADKVRDALETAGWDGAWYRRAYYDDGTPLGSNEDDECRIDAIAQSWSVLSNAAESDRAALAMDSFYRELVRSEDRIALLLTPPFDRTPHDPGYIKAYPPGIRENGGQYTHGVIWSIFAYAALGRADRAIELFHIFNPIEHATTRAEVERYKVEPYVTCADVYSVEPHVGRGGWTWYTGSAGWLYRAGVEAILGFRVRGNTLTLDPCVPATWKGFEIALQRCDGKGVATRYEIRVENPNGVSRGVKRIELDGVELASSVAVPLASDGGDHRVRVHLG